MHEPQHRANKKRAETQADYAQIVVSLLRVALFLAKDTQLVASLKGRVGI